MEHSDSQGAVRNKGQLLPRGRSRNNGFPQIADTRTDTLLLGHGDIQCSAGAQVIKLYFGGYPV